MPGPTPSTSPNRQARPSRDIPWTDLDPAPRTERAPGVPKWAVLSPLAKQWWSWAWKLPVARLWGDAEVPQVVRRAQLEAEWQQNAPATILAEMRHLEAALLMTAKARKEARVRFAAPAADAPKTKGRPAKDDRFRVIDGAA